MSERRLLRWATTSARVVVGTGVAVVAVIAVTAGVAASWPTHASNPVQVTATPAPSDVAVACDGPLLALGRVVEQAGEYTLAAAQDVVSGPASADAVQSDLSAPAGATPQRFVAPPLDGVAASFAASGSSSVDASDLRGFAASACRPPLMESWIVGGSSAVGSNDLVLLANPGDVAATVQITVFGASGPRTTPGGTNRVVPAGAQIVVPLAGIAAGEVSPVIRVTATGAPVAAALQSSLIRTLAPGGVDKVSPLAEAAPRQVIPGVSVTLAAGEAGASDAATFVRLLAPAADASATVSVYRADGSLAAPASSVPLVAGAPSELELGGLDVGRYTIVVEADTPVVAGAWGTTGFGEGSDFAWYAAAPDVTLPTTFAVAAGESPVLTITNTGADAASVEVASDGDDAQSVELAAGEIAEVPLTAGRVYTLDPSSAVAAAVSYASSGAVAGYPIWGADAAAGPVVVFP